MRKHRSRFRSKGWWLWKVRQPRQAVAQKYRALGVWYRRKFPRLLPEDEQWKAWQEEVQVIKTHIVHAHKYRQIFRETTKILTDHPTLSTSPEAGFWYEWLRLMYGHYMAMAVRRELDRGADAPNLYRLLHAIAKRPQVLSRERYVRFFHNAPHLSSEFAQHMGDGTFTTFAGPGAYIDHSIVKKDLGETEKQAKLVVTYADKIVAHRTGHEVDATIKHLHDAIDAYAFGEMLEKYYNLLTGAALFVEPSILVNWHRIFAEPWIQADRPQ
jgi:hypothetical protein